MEFANVLYAVDAGVCTITVNRPDKLNALNQATIAELAVAFASARAEALVRAVILTGAGAKAFVAGADISELAHASPSQCRDLSQAGQRMMRAIEVLGKPVLAAINGFALGGGLELALSCHLRFAAEHAQIGLPEVTLGVLPGFGGTQRLSRLIGRARALEFCLFGERVPAARAQELGLINRVYPAADLASEVRKLAERLAQGPSQAIRGILDAVVQGSECGLDQALELETQIFGLVAASADKAEGTQAFLEKRPAIFRGV